MALTDGNGGGMSPADMAAVIGNGGGWGFGNNGDGWIILFLFAMMSGGFGFGGWGGGYGNMQLSYDFPWLLQGQNGINANTNAGFDHAATQAAIGDLQNSVISGFGDTALGIAGVNQNICQTGSGITAAIANGFSQAEIANNARQIADMQQAFAAQTATTNGLNNISAQLAQCCCDNRLATCQTQNVVQSEAAANRFADANNTRDIIESNNRGNQAILDKLCQLELDGYKNQLDSKNDIIAQLRSDLQYARGQASQDVQTAQILAGQTAEVDALYNRLNNCPVPSTPVYGRQPIFTCPNNGYSCGCGVA